MITFKSSKLDVYPWSNDTYGIVVFDKTLANKLNKYLKYYPDVTIHAGEEPFFKCSIKQMETAAIILGINFLLK